MPRSGSREESNPNIEGSLLARPEENASPDDALPSEGDRAGPATGDRHLTRSECLVVGLVVRGASNKRAARLLGISPRTVEFHRANAMRKLGVHNTAELVRVRMETGANESPQNYEASSPTNGNSIRF